MSNQVEHLRRLVDHLEWADKRVLASLRDARNPSPPVFSLYGHVLGAEHTWLRRIAGEVPTVAIWPSLSLDECDTVAQQNFESLSQIVRSLSASDLVRSITYRNSAGAEFTTGLEDILLHVALHGSYHRGQIAALLRSSGDEPVNTDYIQWVRSVPAVNPARP